METYFCARSLLLWLLTTEAKTRAGLRGTFLSQGQENSGGAQQLESYRNPHGT